MLPLYPPSQEMVLGPVLATNPVAVDLGMSLENTLVTNPRSTSDYECNTVASVGTTGGTAYKGLTDVWYNRVDIGDLFTRSGLTEPLLERPSNAVDTSDLLEDLNTRYRLSLIPEDIVISPVSFDDTHVTLEMSPESVGWIGSVTFRYITVYDYPLRSNHNGLRHTKDGRRRITRIDRRPHP